MTHQDNWLEGLDAITTPRELFTEISARYCWAAMDLSVAEELGSEADVRRLSRQVNALHSLRAEAFTLSISTLRH